MKSSIDSKVVRMRIFYFSCLYTIMEAYMEIKHIPNRINPYECNDYGREPEFVTACDDIIVNCYVSGDDNRANPPKLTFIVNGADEKTTEGVFRFSKEQRDYYTFHLGSFSTGSKIQYSIQMLSDDCVIKTKWYAFDVLASYEFSAPTEVFVDKGIDSESLCLYYSIHENKRMQLKILLNTDYISVQMNMTNKRNDMHNLVKDSYQYNGCEYWLTMDADANSIKLGGKKKEILGVFKKGIHAIKILLDEKDTIQHIIFSMDLSGRAFYGFGEKFDKVNQRGLHPKNCVVEQFTHQMDKTYLPVPFFMTEKGYGVYYDTNHIVDFDIKETIEDHNTVTVSTTIGTAPSKDSFLFFFGTIKEQLQQYITRTGELMLPPSWTFGPWMSANGWDTQKETLEQIENMKKYKIPATVIVLEAWSDEATFYLFHGAKYEEKDGGETFSYKDFRFEVDGKWTNPKEMSKIIHDNDMKLILWQIPVIKQVEDKIVKQHENDERTAIEKGYCVLQADGSPYRITDNWFANSLLIDFTNPEAADWWFSKREYLVNELHVDGFKTDGGEFVYDYESLFYNGMTGYEMKNRYPNAYVGGYYKFLEKMLGKGEGITFSRAGYKGAGSFPTHWAGDQVSEFSELRAQIRAGLSVGLSGVFFWGFDIAGFAGDLPTTELYLRATAVAAFCPIMQFHAEPRTGQFGDMNRRSWNNDRSPWNIAKVNDDATVMDIYRYYANLRMNLLPYICNEAKHAIKECRPLFAHLIYDYEEDEKVYEIEDEYMFGRGILVAPILYEGQEERSVYLPTGIWYDFFTNQPYTGGKEYVLPCELGEILIFIKEGSILPMNLSETLELGSYVGNNSKSYANLCFIVYGEQGECSYEDETGNHLLVQYSNQEGKVDEEGRENNTKIVSSVNLKHTYDSN